MSWLLVAPILIPFASAVASGLLGRRWVSVAGAAALLAAAIALLVQVASEGVRAVQIADWPAPFGITLVADHLSAFMVAIAGLMGFAVAIYALADIDPPRRRAGFDPLFQMLLAGVCGAFLSGDLFNLYVWFEVVLIASFGLLALGAERAQLDGAVKYVVLNLVSTLLLLAAIGLLYGMTGTLNMADLHRAVPGVENRGLLSAVGVMFLVAIGVKAAIFPLFFWLPASYHTPPVAVSALFAGIVTKVGVYALMRIFTLIFDPTTGRVHSLLLVIAGLTIISGVLGAIAQNEIRRILAFHSISQIGYVILGLALFTPLALAGAVFFMAHHSVVKAALFLISGVARRFGGSFELKELGGLYRRHPGLAFLFLAAGLSLAGMPPFPGFWAKLILVKASLAEGAYPLAAVALGAGLLTLFSMTKIWAEAFWKPLPDRKEPAQAAATRELPFLLGPIALLTVIGVFVGMSLTPILNIAARSAEELLEPAIYVDAVLGQAR